MSAFSLYRVMYLWHRLWRFFSGSLVGLMGDFCTFKILQLFGMNVFSSNIFSSCVSITITYFLVTRYVFNLSSSWKSFIGFCAWYGCSIVFFSWAIHTAVLITHWPAILCKFLSLFFSFPSNFTFSYFFMGRSHRVCVPHIEHSPSTLEDHA